MGDTYTRQSSYTDGDVITAEHTNNEFNQLLAAFAATTGHSHDGTAGEGGIIANLLSNAITIGTGADTDIVLTFNGNTSDGVLTWDEDLDHFKFSDDVLINSTQKLYFFDEGDEYIYASTNGQLDIVAGAEVQIVAPAIDINGNVDISGTLTVAGAVDFGDAALSNVGAVQLDSIAGDGDTDTSITFSGSNVITVANAGTNQVTFNDGSISPVTDSDVDLGTTSLRFKDVYIDSATVTGEVAAASLDISGNIDVDGITNLDVVDIDGAVNINAATTIATINKIQFRDTGLYINSSTDGQLDIVADTEIQIAATTIDIDGAVVASGEIAAVSLDISGDIDIDGTANLDVVDIDGAVDMATTLAVAGNVDFNGDLDVDGTTNLDAVDIDGAVQLDATLTVGANDQGYDVILYGDTASANLTWDTSTDDLILNGAAGLIVPDGQLTLGSTAVTSTAAELNLLDTAAANSVVNSKAVIYGSSGEVAGTLSTAAQANVTSLGTLTALTVDDVAVDGKVITMTGSASDTAVITAGADGTLSIVTTDAAAAAANIQITADGTAEVAGTTVTLDSSGGITLDADGGTITFADAGASLGTITSSGYSGSAATLTTPRAIAVAGDVTGTANFDGSAGISITTTLATDAIVTANITNANVTLAKMAANSVDSDQYVDGSIDTAHYAANSITGAELADNIDIAGTLDVTGLLTADANVVVAGNLTVNGTTTTLNTATLDVEDKNITINYGAGDTSGSANGAGITIQDAIDASNDATILWDTTNDEFDFSHPINVAGKVTSTGTSVFASLDISGDIDVDGTTNLDVVDIDGAVDMASTLAVAGTATFTGLVDAAIIDGANFKVNGGQGSDGQVLTSTGSGVAWEDAGGLNLIDEDNMATNSATRPPSQQSTKAYVDSLTAGNIVATGALNSGSITSGFGTINNGASAITTTGVGTFASLDISGSVDVDGTLEADAITLNGTALGSLYSPIAGGSGIVTTGALNSGSITSGFGAIDNGASAITTTGPGTFGSLDIAGDIDVDGITNLDAVDIDGAVNMAGTLTISPASGYANFEMGGPSGAFIDMKNPASDDYDARIIWNGSDLKLETTSASGGDILFQHGGANTKLRVKATGIAVTGTAVATTDTDTSNTGNVTLDFAANQNFVLTLTGNTTLVNPTTEQVGQSGFISFIQDGTGSRVLSVGDQYFCAGGSVIVLSTAANSIDIVPYVVIAAGKVCLGAPQLAFADAS